MKTAVVIILSSLFWVWAFETISLYYTNNYGDGLDKAKVLLEPHEKIGWIQRANFEGSFIDQLVRVSDNHFRLSLTPYKVKKEQFKVLTLGPSSAFGWGVKDSETYSFLLNQYLNEKLPIEVSVLNASQIGFSSFQGRLLVENHPILKEMKPHLIILSYGVNDIDRHRFYFQNNKSDANFLTPENLATGIFKEKLLNSSHGVRLFNRKFNSFLTKSKCPQISEIPGRRVSIDNLIKNFEFIAKKFPKTPILIINTANAYKSDPSVTYMDDKTISELSARESLSSQELSQMESGKNSHHFYKLASLKAQMSDCQQARNLLEQALKYEEYRISADLEHLNQRLLLFSQKEESFYHVDAFSALNRPENRLKYFVDPIHPNSEGHRLIALDIMRVILDNNLHE